MLENPKWLADDLRTHAQTLSHAMDAELRARPTPPNRFEPVFDDGVFMVLRCCAPPAGLARGEDFELRFSPDNARPDPQMLVRMGAALAHIRHETLLIGDERESQDISVSLTATPFTTPNMLMRGYNAQCNEFKTSVLMHRVQADVLANKFSTLPPYSLTCVSRNGKILEYSMAFKRPMAPEQLKQIADRIAGWCNQADEGTNEGMQQLRETLNVRRPRDAYQVVAGPAHEGSNNALTLMVPEGFIYSAMALSDLADKSHRCTR